MVPGYRAGVNAYPVAYPNSNIARKRTSNVTDVHFNPDAGHREIWIRDLDGYLVIAEP